MITKKIISKCGVNCTLCPAFKQNIEDDEYIKEIIAGFQKYHDQHLEELYCDGCQCSDINSKQLNTDCKVRACALEKSVENCGYCNAYPCNHMKKVFKVIENIIERVKNTSPNQETDYRRFVLPFLNKKRLDLINFKCKLKDI